jgi:pro-sigmaK processing inhibitor BofA
MENMNGALMIGIAFALVLLIAAMRSKTELLINFIMRAVLGTLAIYFINMFLQGFAWRVGIGPFSIIASGLLGLPGVALLYGINVVSML